MVLSATDLISPVEDAVLAMGTAGMMEATFRAVSAVASICELSAWCWPAAGSPRAIVYGGRSSGCEERTQSYRTRYFSFDPVCQTIGRASHEEWITMTVDPSRIRHHGYAEQCYRRPAFVEKVAIARWLQSRWYVLNLYRSTAAGHFLPAELDRLAVVARMMLPLLAKHHELTCGRGSDVLSEAERIGNLEKQLATLEPALSPREASVCAYTVAGYTAQRIATELGIKLSTVLTYRRRAYERLSISSGYDLAARLMR